MRTTFAAGWRPFAALLLLLLLADRAAAQSTAELLRDGFARYDASQLETARARFDAALKDAETGADAPSQAEAQRGLGLVFLARADYPAARGRFEAALALFERLGDRAGVARCHQHLAQTARMMGESPRARDLENQALTEYRALGDERSEARLLVQMSYAANDERQALLDRAEPIAARLGDTRLLGDIALNRGDAAYGRADFAAAQTHLEAAIRLFEQAGERTQLARALTSLGRLLRTHGHPEQAVPLYRRAIALQRATGDQQGIIQSINALGVAYGAMGRGEASLAQYRHALALARATGSQRLIAFQLGNLGGGYLKQRDYARAARTIEEALRLPNDDHIAGFRHGQLADAYLPLRRYRDSLAAADKAVAVARAERDDDSLNSRLLTRARARHQLGDDTGALADARESLDRLDDVRRHLVPSDFMKQGFGETYSEGLGLAVELFHHLHDEGRALETAERAEARAFLDLLASRRAAGRDAAAALNKGDLASPESAAAVSLDEIRATAARRDAALLAYFVAGDATFVWTVTPSGAVQGRRLPISATTLSTLVASTRHAGGGGAARGTQAFLPSPPPAAVWRQLYRLLVLPIRASLPRHGRLIVIPHGPLFALSFAALQDERGGYLIERYTISYAPSVGMLRFTAPAPDDEAGGGRYLLVADPARPPLPPAGAAALPPLPGSRREIAGITRAIGAAAVTTLIGRDADEASVRAGMAAARVIHLATHGIVRDDRPLESFLALGRAGAADGRLTPEEIYDLDLHADLVVLSACRSALGRISGDGISGLTRAFFYAGASTIVATVWDVADEPTHHLLPEFYRLRGAGASKAEALRGAQLRLLRELRAGRIKVQDVALPEHPYFWAAFVLTGEP